MQFLFPLIVILLSLVVVGGVLWRRRGQLALLDVDRIPSVQEAKKKDEYLKKRIIERGDVSRSVLWKRFGVPLADRFTALQRWFRSYVGKIEREVFSVTHPSVDDVEVADDEMSTKQEQQQDVPVEEKSAKEEVTIDTLLQKARHAAKEEEWEKAEKNYINVIGMDDTHVDAYKGLAAVYAAQGQLTEAKETYEFLQQLHPQDDEVFARLGDIAAAEDDVEQAIQYYEQAILLNAELAPRYVRLAELFRTIEEYPSALEAMQQAVFLEADNEVILDKYTELAILALDKKAAQDGVERLRMANPDHPRIQSYQERAQQLTAHG